MTQLEHIFEIRGEYPDGTKHRSFVVVEDQVDAIAIAQGLRKVTTIRRIAVYSCCDDRCVYYDELRIQK